MCRLAATRAERLFPPEHHTAGSMPEPLPYAPASSRPRGFLAPFAPDPPAPIRITDPDAVAQGFRHGQIRVLGWAILGYAMFYFVRKNLSIAMPVMGKELGITKDSLGLFLTA